jgi:hypothetical protein
MMRLVQLEIKKIAVSRAILTFFVLCLAFNALIIWENGTDGYAGYVAGVSRDTGIVLGHEFDGKLAALPRSEYREWLIDETYELGNVFDGYDAKDIAEKYIGALKLSGTIAEDMRKKYAELQNAVNEKASRGDGLFLYFAGSTYRMHQNLFNAVMFALLTEGILISILTTLFALGYENVNRTEHVIYASKTGRRIAVKKLIAALTAGIGAYLLLAAVTLFIYFTTNDYGGVWGSNVSSGFNAIFDIIAGGYRPFSTWHGFTVLTYLLATVGASLGVILCITLAGFTAGVSVRNSYMAFLTVFLAGALCVAFPMVLPANSYTRFGFILTPVWLWLKQPLWFTDGGMDVLWRDFEITGICFSLAALAICSVAAGIKFKRKELL